MVVPDEAAGFTKGLKAKIRDLETELEEELKEKAAHPLEPRRDLP